MECKTTLKVFSLHTTVVFRVKTQKNDPKLSITPSRFSDLITLGGQRCQPLSTVKFGPFVLGMVRIYVLLLVLHSYCSLVYANDPSPNATFSVQRTLTVSFRSLCYCTHFWTSYHVGMFLAWQCFVFRIVRKDPDAQ